MFNQHTLDIPIGNKTLTLETGKVARQANGSIVISCGETVLLATACASTTVAPEIDFLPLRVDYQEKFSSVGRTAAGFIKREGRPAEREVLISRLIDRPLRPMFEEGYYNEIQILTFTLSYDLHHQPDVLAICGASFCRITRLVPFITGCLNSYNTCPRMLIS